MKEIQLSKGFVTVVDDEDYEYLSQWKWKAIDKGNHVYAARTKRCGPRKEGKSKTIYLHRSLIECDSLIVDHINLNSLDNRKQNLRVSNKSQNISNQKKRKSKTSSKYKGVGWNKQRNKWKATICKNYKIYHLGFFSKELEAARAYNRAAVELHGEFACLNEL